MCVCVESLGSPSITRGILDALFEQPFGLFVARVLRVSSVYLFKMSACTLTPDINRALLIIYSTTVAEKTTFLTEQNSIFGIGCYMLGLYVVASCLN